VPFFVRRVLSFGELVFYFWKSFRPFSVVSAFFFYAVALLFVTFQKWEIVLPPLPVVPLPRFSGNDLVFTNPVD